MKPNRLEEQEPDPLDPLWRDVVARVEIDGEALAVEAMQAHGDNVEAAYFYIVTCEDRAPEVREEAVRIVRSLNYVNHYREHIAA